MNRTEHIRDTDHHRMTMRTSREVRIRMPALADAARRFDCTAPAVIDPTVYSVLRAVWHTYPRAAANWRSVISPVLSTTDDRMGLNAGIPLLDETMIQWEAAPLQQQHRRLLRLFRSPPFSDLEALGDLLRLLDLGPDEQIRWARLYFRAKTNDSRPELLFGGFIIQPFLYAFARQVLAGFRQEDWRRKHCPVCGGRPYHGYFHHRSRHKILICGRCQFPWTVPRLRCSFCENTRQESLGYLYQDHSEHHRIDFCTACRTILPITMHPESDSPFPLHDHLVSLPLQLAVERKQHDA